MIGPTVLPLTMESSIRIILLPLTFVKIGPAKHITRVTHIFIEFEGQNLLNSFLT